ncbi:hypothetical protein [Prolixibacter bellariivorans]|uniref:hypothetical protein n=1 Tax=Prolixibacter bellariivorans TaxID=314319 RepID=UPI0005642A77|nr:hypothetical protein [Prolixibacter bellariivorans]
MGFIKYESSRISGDATHHVYPCLNHNYADDWITRMKKHTQAAPSPNDLAEAPNMAIVCRT